jgi:outer membrane protein assembly factor BamB
VAGLGLAGGLVADRSALFDHLGVAPAGEQEVVLPTTALGEAVGDDGGADDAGTASASDLCTVDGERRACVRWSQGLVTDDWAAADATDAIVVTGASGAVRAYDPGTGAARWRTQLDGPAVLRTVAPSSVVVTVGERSIVLDTRSGEEVASAGRVRRAAATRDGIAALAEGDILTFEPDGSERWRTAIPSRSLAWVTAAGAVLSSPLSVLADEVTALDPVDGAPSWTVATTGRVGGVHAVGELLLVAVEDTGRGASVLLLRDDGEVVAEHDVRGRVAFVTAAEDGSAVVVLERSDSAGVLVIEPERGLARPVTDLGDGAGDTWAVTAADGIVAVGVSRPTPEVVVFGRRDGLIRLRIPLDEPGRALALPGDATVVASLDGSLTAWSLGTGGVRWQLGTDGAAEVLREQPLVVSDRTTLLAIEPDPARRSYRPMSPRTSGDRREASGEVLRDVLGTRRSHAH